MLTRLIQALRPAQDFPIAVRYATTTAIVLLCLSVRLLFSYELSGVPFLVFFPAVVIAALLFDSAAGVYATILSAVLITWVSMRGEPSYDLPPRGLAAGGIVFLIVGAFVAMTLEALRRAVDAMKAAQAELRREHEILERLFAQTPDVLVVVNPEARCLRINDAGAAFLGVAKEEVVGKAFCDFFPPAEAELVEGLTREIVRTRQGVTVDVTLTPPSGVPRTFLVSSAPVFDAGDQVFGIASVAKDIEARKALEDYKALLLQDLNHRVKNDLQSIAAFLDLSGRRTGDAHARDAMATAVRRIHVLARVYDQLRLKGSSPSVSAKAFIEGLCEDLKSSLAGVKPVGLKVEVEEGELENPRAVAVGLIINELVTNAGKYAFPDGRAGTIEISLARDGCDYKLRVADDGVGSTGREPPGEGTRLVRMLAQQLGGEVERGGPPGTIVCIRFPLRAAVSGPAAPTSPQLAS